MFDFHMLIGAIPETLAREAAREAQIDLVPSPEAAIRRRHERLPVDVFGLAGDLGYQVAFASLGHHAGLLLRSARPRRLVLNSDYSPFKQRLVAAHLLSHHILHGEHIGDVFAEGEDWCSGRLDAAAEKEANALALQIVLPQQRIDGLLAVGLPFAEVARRLGVDELVLALRMGLGRPCSGAV